MSPENGPERKRVSKGFAKHVSREKAADRRLHDPLIPSWELIIGKIELLTANKFELHQLFFGNRIMVKDFYDATYDIVVRRKTKKMESFNEKYKDPNSPDYEPENLPRLEPVFRMVTSAFPKPIRNRR